MVYYHPLRSCTGLDDDDAKAGKLVVPREVHRLLKKVHLRHLCKEFKLELDWTKLCYVLRRCICYVFTQTVQYVQIVLTK